MSDPFTNETCLYPKAFSVHLAKNHRILGDLNRDVTAQDIFREKDFYGRQIWKKGQELSEKEKEVLLKKFWMPYRESIM